MPPTKPYELSALAVDLVLLARYMLKPGGRLVFFLPTVTDEYAELDVQTMLCEGMELVANSLQDFGSWGRRVSRGGMRAYHTRGCADHPASPANHTSKSNFRDVPGAFLRWRVAGTLGEERQGLTQQHN